jgi:hypothetical protein
MASTFKDISHLEEFYQSRLNNANRVPWEANNLFTLVAPSSSNTIEALGTNSISRSDLDFVSVRSPIDFSLILCPPGC